MSDSAKWRFYYQKQETLETCLRAVAATSRERAGRISSIEYHLQSNGSEDDALKPEDYKVCVKHFPVGDSEIPYPAYQLWRDYFEFGMWVESSIHPPPYRDHWSGKIGHDEYWLLPLDCYVVEGDECCMFYVDVGHGVDYGGIDLNHRKDQCLTNFFNQMNHDAQFVIHSAVCIGDSFLTKYRDATIEKFLPLQKLGGYLDDDEDFRDDLDNMNLACDPIYRWLDENPIG